MILSPTKIPGCFEIYPVIYEDERGRFVKTYHAPEFSDMGLCTNFIEEYYSVSSKDVIRGLHFQLPPHDHVKLVYCTSGRVMDVVVDLRKDSVTFGKHIALELSSDKANILYIPKGMAHGFCVLSEQATMVYQVSAVYSSECDSGIRWDSAGIDWPVSKPIISQRDLILSTLAEFNSPFKFGEQ